MNKLFKRLTVFLFVVTSTFSYSQTESFDLSSYKRPDLKRKTLQTDGALRGSGRYGPQGIGFINSFPFSFEANVRYTYFKNNEKNQNFGSHGIFMDFEKDLEQENNGRFIINYFNTISNRIFFAEEKFIGYEIEMSGSHTRNFGIGSFNNSDNRISIPLRFGKGRIEFVTDAWNALVILKDLEKNGLLSRSMTHEEIYSFAQKIGDIKNARFFDFRYQNIYELTELSNFLQDQGLTESSIGFFTKLQDNWRYETFRQRKAGSSYGVELKTDLKIKIENFQENGTTYYLGVFYERYKPINHRWQFDQSYSLSLGTGDTRNSFIFSFLRGFQKDYAGALNANWSIANYINARSYFELSYEQNLLHYFNDIKYTISGDFNFNFNRWISPKLLMNIRTFVSVYGRDTSFSGPSTFYYPGFSMNWTYYIL